MLLLYIYTMTFGSIWNVGSHNIKVSISRYSNNNNTSNNKQTNNIPLFFLGTLPGPPQFEN